MILKREIRVLVAIMVSSLLVPFATLALNLSLPDIGRLYGVDSSELGWLLEIFLLVAIVCLLPMGKLAERWGKKNIYLSGLAIFSLSALFAVFVENFSMLLVLRAVQGLGGAMFFATGMAILTLAFPQERRGYALGWNVSMVYTGLALGPALGGFLNYYFGWQSIFLFQGIFGILGTLIGVYSLPSEQLTENLEKEIDGKGGLLYASSMVALVYGLSELFTDFRAPYLLIFGSVFFAILCRHESKIENPLLPLQLFRENRAFSASSLAAMLNYSATFGITFLLSVYLQSLIGVNSNQAGLLLLMQPLLMAALSPMMGRLSDRQAPMKLAALGMGVISAGLILLVYAVHVRTLYGILPCIAVIGIGFSLFSAPNNNAVMSSVRKEQFTLAASALGTVRLMGQVISMALVSLFLSMRCFSSQEDNLSYNIQLAFFVFALLCIVGIIIPRRMRKHSM